MIAPLRALGPEMDTFAMVPAPALVRLHQDPEEPMPYVSDTALVDDAARRRRSRRCWSRRPGLAARR